MNEDNSQTTISTAEEEEEDDIDSLGIFQATVVVAFVEIVLSLVTIVINPITVMSMINGRMFKRSTNLFITSLCCSDFCLGIGVLLQKTVHCILLTGTRTSLMRGCSWFAGIFTCVAFFSSLHNVILIGVDRAIATVVPMQHYQLMSVRRSLIVLLLMWLLIVVLNVAPLPYIFSRIQHVDDLDIFIYPTEYFPENYTIRFNMPYTMVGMFVNCVVYGTMVTFFFKASKRLNQQSSLSDKRRHQMTKMVMFTVLILVLFNVPIVVLGTLPPPDSKVSPNDYSPHHLIYECALVLMLIPTFINNVIYAWKNEEFRRAYVRFLCRGRKNVIEPYNVT